MKAILIKEFGAPENLYIGHSEHPQPATQEVLVKVKATALNRADTLQRQGKYAPPAGESLILGLEISGEIIALGEGVTKWNIGDKICGLIGGGGYAELAVIHEDMALPIPDNLSFEEAAAIPEVFLTAWQAISWLGKLQNGERILVHAGASGVGTAAIQIAKHLGAEVFATASAGKHNTCLRLGADQVIDYKTSDFESVVNELGGVNMVLDFIAAPYFQKNLNVLKLDGRLVMLAFLGGIQAEVNLVPFLRKRLSVMGSTLRNRSLDYKIALTQDLKSNLWECFKNESIVPVIDSVYDWQDVADAHHYMECNKNIGKIVMMVRA